MSVKKILSGFALLFLLGSGIVVATDFDKGLKALQSEDFKTALLEWTPLAKKGNADAQNNLGFIFANNLHLIYLFSKLD